MKQIVNKGKNKKKTSKSCKKGAKKGSVTFSITVSDEHHDSGNDEHDQTCEGAYQAGNDVVAWAVNGADETRGEEKACEDES